MQLLLIYWEAWNKGLMVNNFDQCIQLRLCV